MSVVSFAHRLKRALFFDAPTRRFIRHNRLRWRGWARRDAQDVILVELIDWTQSIYCYSFVLNHLARRLGAAIECFSFYGRPKGLRGLRGAISRRLVSLYRSIGARVTLTLGSGAHHSARAARDAAAVLSRLRGKTDLLQLDVNGCVIGDLVYDSYLRGGRPTLDLEDPVFREMLEQAFLIYYTAEGYFEKKRVRAVFVTHGVYMWSGILLRLAGKRGVPCFTVHLQHFRIEAVSSESPLLSNRYLSYPEHFGQLGAARQAAALAEGRELIQQRLSGLIDDRILTGISAYTPAGDSRILSTSEKPKMLVLSSCLFDAVHVYDWMLFPDFYDWLVFTLTIASETDFEWYVKPHPAGFPGNEEVMEQLQKRFPRVHFLRKTDSNTQIVREGIKAAFSVHGTAAHEFAYLGIPVVLAGDNAQIRYNFNLHCRTIEEYERAIRRADSLELSIDKKQIEEYVYMQYIHGQGKNVFGAQPIDAAFFGMYPMPDILDNKARKISRYNEPWTLDYFLDRETPEQQGRIDVYLKSFFDATFPARSPLTAEPGGVDPALDAVRHEHVV